MTNGAFLEHDGPCRNIPFLGMRVERQKKGEAKTDRKSTVPHRNPYPPQGCTISPGAPMASPPKTIPKQASLATSEHAIFGPQARMFAVNI
jgi:hypothetical protein